MEVLLYSKLFRNFENLIVHKPVKGVHCTVQYEYTENSHTEYRINFAVAMREVAGGGGDKKKDFQRQINTAEPENGVDITSRLNEREDDIQRVKSIVHP
jgi:hypothetical protein